MLFNSSGEGFAREKMDAKRRRIHHWAPSPPLNRHPNLERFLRGQVVKTQRRQQANDAFRNSLCGLNQAVVLAHFGASQPIQPAPVTLDDTLFKEPGERHRVYTSAGEFACADHSGCLHKLNRSFYFARFRHYRSCDKTSTYLNM